jgi:hypothetical protein
VVFLFLVPTPLEVGSQRRADEDFLIGFELVEPKFYNPLHNIQISELSMASFKNLSPDGPSKEREPCN